MKTIIAILFLGFTANSFAQDQKPKSQPLVIDKGNSAPVRKAQPASATTLRTPIKAKKAVYKKDIASPQPIPSKLER